MQAEHIDTSRPAPGPDATTILTDRNQSLNQFIIANYRDLTDAAYTAYPNLLVLDCEKAIIRLGNALIRYTGPAEQTPFLKWATRFVTKEAQRYRIAGRIITNQMEVIHAAIRNNLWTSASDCADEHQDVFWEIVELIFQKAHSLNRRGSAKLSTRVTALVKKHCFLYYNAKNARRRKLIKEQLEANKPINCECLSDEELASMKADQVYDPGYSEVGLSM